MKRYKCIKPMHLDIYDENGFLKEENSGVIDVGEIYAMNDDTRDCLLIASKPAIRLENARCWIEIYPITLAEHFEELEGDEEE